MYRESGDVTVADEDDGCPAGNHTRNELCARTPLKSLPPLDLPEPETQDDRGGPT